MGNGLGVRRVTRRTKEQRREDYLDIGASLVAESTASAKGFTGEAWALAHVKLAEVAARAGVTKGAMYHLWPSQEAYWADLLQHLMDTTRLVGADKLATVEAELTRATDTDPDLREYANALFDSLSRDPAFFARVALFSYLDDESVRDCLDEEFRAAVERVTPVLAATVSAMGRRPRTPTALQELAVAVGALLEGLCLQHRIDPARTPDVPLDRDRRWTLFAASADALLLAFTEPDEPADSSDRTPTRRAGVLTGAERP